MLDVRFFIANLLCVFIPLFGIEIWQLRSVKTFWVRPVFASSLLASAVMCNMFNFPISDGISVNLSIVPIAIEFCLFSWPMGLFMLLLYTLANLSISVVLLAHGRFTMQVVYTFVSSLPHAFTALICFAVIMSLCSAYTRRRSFSYRATAFVVCLFGYSLLDFAYVHHIHHYAHFRVMPFLGFVACFNFTFVIAARMITAAENAKERRAQELRVAQMQSISQLAASVAHEIRNPITVVHGFTQLMLEQDVDATKSRQFLEIMHGELTRAESVISDYLQISKLPDSGSSTTINLSTVVEHIMDVMQVYALTHTVSLQRSIEANLFIVGNQSHVTQAIINLVKNAIESHDDTGTVEVALRQANSAVELRVTDGGRGIPSSHLAKLGQPYYSTKTEGTGLGLTLTYKVVSDMSGKIEVKSKEGVGTTFVVTIPQFRNPTFITR